MWTEHDADDREWVRTVREVDRQRPSTCGYRWNSTSAANRRPLAWRRKTTGGTEGGRGAASGRSGANTTSSQAGRVHSAAGNAEPGPAGLQILLPKLRQASLDEHPELVNHYGSLTLQVQNWLQLIAGKDVLLSETMPRPPRHHAERVGRSEPQPTGSSSGGSHRSLPPRGALSRVARNDESRWRGELPRGQVSDATAGAGQ